MKLQNIVFPVDFSGRSHAAAPFVQSLARRYGATITLLHAIQPLPPMYFDMGAVYPEAFDQEPLTATLEARLRAFADEEFPRMATRCSVLNGEPARVIVDCAHELDAGMIALPTHGYGLFRRALLGSVTSKVLHDSRVPVWTSAHCTEASHRAHPQPRLILAAIDLKSEAEHTLETALEMARDMGAAVEILHIEPEGHVTSAVPEVEVERVLVGAAAAGAIDVEERREERTEVITNGESVAGVVRRVALLKRADLVVIGRGSMHGNLLERMHSHAYSVICESPCPVLSV